MKFNIFYIFNFNKKIYLKINFNKLIILKLIFYKIENSLYKK